MFILIAYVDVALFNFINIFFDLSEQSRIQLIYTEKKRVKGNRSNIIIINELN